MAHAGYDIHTSVNKSTGLFYFHPWASLLVGSTSAGVAKIDHSRLHGGVWHGGLAEVGLHRCVLDPVKLKGCQNAGYHLYSYGLTESGGDVHVAQSLQCNDVSASDSRGAFIIIRCQLQVFSVGLFPHKEISNNDGCTHCLAINCRTSLTWDWVWPHAAIFILTFDYSLESYKFLYFPYNPVI